MQDPADSHYELTILLPYYNERGWLGPTIDSLVAQTDQSFRLILIDNASSDGSELESQRHAAPLGARVRHLMVEEPGKTQALAAAQRLVDTPLLAVCDADTIYPPGYVACIRRLFGEDPAVATVLALDLYAPAGSAKSLRRANFILGKAQRRPGHCHAGAYAQAFRSAAFFAAGGFDPRRWPYLMEDHEIVHQVLRFGRARYAKEHFCFPADRRKNRSSAGWNRFERLVYRLVPREDLNWFFYTFLARRLAARRSLAPALRHRDWQAPHTSDRPRKA
jgi:glycosyltransferase involved in cell wall biosynthesis